MNGRGLKAGWLVAATAVVAVACGSTNDGGDPDPGPGDVADVGNPSDAADPGPTDPGPRDDGPADPGPGDPGPQDPGVDPGPACEDVSCSNACPKGYRTDLRGCPTCECRECAANNDCYGQIACDDPVCDEGGRCGCTCFGAARVDYTCPDGTEVPWCDCSPLGKACIESPEFQCPTLCRPGPKPTFPCPDGTPRPWCECRVPTCRIECRPDGDLGEGWYDTCSGAKVLGEPCRGCGASCQQIGLLDEGWYSSCGGAAIDKRLCGPYLDCQAGAGDACGDVTWCTPGQSATWTCPDGVKVAFCACEPPAAKCQPNCVNPGGAGEGWRDPCTGAFHAGPCKDCTIACGGVGGADEGWTSSCGGLVFRAKCGTPEWSCRDKPWEACTNHPLPCTAEGGLREPSGDWTACCPGLIPIESAWWNGESCSFPAVEVLACTRCGDGLCVPPENRCNCLEDCLGEPWPKGRGALCGFGGECAADLSCVRRAETDPLGICTAVCTPSAPGIVDPCPDGFACVPIPDHQAPGFCLRACEFAGDCAHPLTCGRVDTFTGPTACFPWP